MWGPHQSPNCFCMNWFSEFHCLESWSLFMLVENRENQENGWKSKKIVKMHAKRKNGNKRLLKSGFYCLKKIRRWFSKIRVIWMKMILKTQFKTGEITTKKRGVQNKEGSVHQSGHIGVRLGGLAIAGLLMVVWRGLCTLLACLEKSWPYSLKRTCSLAVKVIAMVRAHGRHVMKKRPQLLFIEPMIKLLCRSWGKNVGTQLKSSSNFYATSSCTLVSISTLRDPT